MVGNKLLLIVLSYLFCSEIIAQSIILDELNQITQIDYGNGFKIQYSYDNLGNRTQQIITAGCIALAPNEMIAMDFEHGIAPWRQVTNVGDNWTVYEGSTPSNNTGPTAASNNTQYAYIEANGNLNQYFELVSPCIDLSGLSDPEFSMDYHMYGAATGSLTVEASYNGGTSWSVLMQPITGNQGNTWLNFTGSLSTSASTIIRISAQAGSAGTSDIAIDNITISEPECVQNLLLTAAPDPAYMSSQTIETSGTVPINSGQNTIFRSQAIFLKPGMHAKAGSVFRAYIDPCSN